MRLPAITEQQQANEEARQFNEQLYQAYLDKGVMEIKATHATIQQKQVEVSSNGKHFWNRRQFHFRTRMDRKQMAIVVWLEAVTDAHPRLTRQRHNGNEAWQMAGAKKVGPIAQLVCVECAAPSERRRAWDTFELGECGKCGGDLKPRVNVQAVRADAKAKRELQEQGA